MVTAIPFPICLDMVVRHWTLGPVITKCTFGIPCANGFLAKVLLLELFPPGGSGARASLSYRMSQAIPNADL